MKRIRALGLIVTLIIMVFSCEKDKDPAGQRNTAVIPVISNINPGIFDSKDLLNSYVEFNVDVPEGTQVDKVVIMGSYKDNFERIEIAEVTSFPSTVRISSATTAEKLGIALNDITNGEVFTFELLTVANGLTTRSNAVLNVSVACAFANTLAAGSYHTVSLDWGSEGDITLTADPNDPYTIFVTGIEEIEGLVEDKGPLVMHIDPATFEVIADKSVLASDAFDYTDITYEGSGIYNSCNGSYTMNFDISVVEGNFGRFLFNFTRNP